MRNYKVFIVLLVLVVSFIFWACSEKDPIGIKQLTLTNPDGNPPVLTNVQVVGDSVLIEWVDNATFDSEFRINRKIEEGAFNQIAVIDSMYYEYYDTYEFEDSTLVTYYVETVGPDFTQQSNQVEILIEIYSAPAPEYFLSGFGWFNLEIEEPGETDVIEWTSLGSDLDVEIYNYSATMDLAIRVWDENGDFIGEFNDGGTGEDDFI